LDWNLYPRSTARFSLLPTSLPRWTGSGLKIQAKNGKTKQTETISLVPMARTALRQLSFAVSNEWQYMASPYQLHHLHPNRITIRSFIGVTLDTDLIAGAPWVDLSPRFTTVADFVATLHYRRWLFRGGGVFLNRAMLFVEYELPLSRLFFNYCWQSSPIGNNQQCWSILWAYP
jgi:hypothetical protein